MGKLSLVLLLVAGCQPPATPPDAGLDASALAPEGSYEPQPSACARACVNLAALGCREAAPEAGCDHACSYADGVYRLKPECLATAKTKGEARACGSVTCP